MASEPLAVYVRYMHTATIEELQRDLQLYLSEVEKGAEVIISRNNKPIARLMPVADADWYALSAQGLAAAYGPGEPDYEAVPLKA